MPKQTDYQLLKDIYETVNRLDEKFDERFEKLEKRVNILEQWKWYLMGMVAVISTGISMFKDQIFSKIGVKI